MKTVNKAELDSKALELKSIIDEYYQLKLRLESLNNLAKPYGFMISHAEDCDDDYQEALEINWERNDIRDNMNELSKNANEIICYFINNNYGKALNAWASKFSENLSNFIKDRKYKLN